MSMLNASDGAQIFYRDWSLKNAQPVLFHHGWPLSPDDWDTRVLFFLTRGYRFVAHDRLRLAGGHRSRSATSAQSRLGRALLHTLPVTARR